MLEENDKLESIDSSFPLGYASKLPSRDGKKRNHWAARNIDEYVRYPKVKPLSFLKLARLAEKAKEGDESARDQIWLSNVRLTLSVVNEFAIPDHLLPDACQAGVLGLVRAIERYDPQQLHEFTTYAYHWVRSRVRRLLSEEKLGFRIPSYLYHDYIGFRRSISRLRQRSEWFDWRESWLEESPKQYARLILLHNVVSARREYLWSPQLRELRCDDDPPDLLCARLEIDIKIREAVRRLDGRLRDIIIRRHGLFGREQETLEEIAFTLGVTRERVRQLQVVAERKLRRRLTKYVESSGENGHVADVGESTSNGESSETCEEESRD